MRMPCRTRGALGSVAVGLLALGVGCARKPEAPAAAPVPVVVAKVESRDVPRQVEAIGTVEALSTVAVRTQVTGQLATVHFREGSEVREGDLLFSLDARPFEAAVHQAEANQARDQAQAAKATIDARRAEDLFGQGIVPQEELDQAKATADALAAAVKADAAAVENARLQLAYCSIRAPIGGRTGSLLVHAGNVVKAVDGGPLVTIDRVDPIFVSFAIPERSVPALRRARKAGALGVQVLVSGEEDQPIKGSLSFVDNAVDPSTGTLRLKGRFANPERRLWPGLFVKIRLTLSTDRGAVVVPSQALQTGQQGTFVFVVKPDQTVETRAVAAGAETDGETVVTSGLAPGETVVTDGQLRLVPGASVATRTHPVGVAENGQ